MEKSVLDVDESVDEFGSSSNPKFFEFTNNCISNEKYLKSLSVSICQLICIYVNHIVTSLVVLNSIRTHCHPDDESKANLEGCKHSVELGELTTKEVTLIGLLLTTYYLLKMEQHAGESLPNAQGWENNFIILMVDDQTLKEFNNLLTNDELHRVTLDQNQSHPPVTAQHYYGELTAGNPITHNGPVNFAYSYNPYSFADSTNTYRYDHSYPAQRRNIS
uniref:Sulfatase domain-containing protein n=1 Tax=Strongyloides papillosus TaxID=174720 RepID=A0A0N5B2L0_STREA